LTWLFIKHYNNVFVFLLSIWIIFSCFINYDSNKWLGLTYLIIMCAGDSRTLIIRVTDIMVSKLFIAEYIIINAWC